jgi:hypothetical protein
MNIAPVAILKVTPQSQTLPDNKFILDGSESYDPNPNGKIINWQFSQDGVIIYSGNTRIISVIGTEAGNIEFKLVVQDKGGLEDVAVETATLKTDIINK